jgi:5'-3' exonuclease
MPASNVITRQRSLKSFRVGLRYEKDYLAMKIHLIDGTYELFRSHFGQPPRNTPEGRPIGAVRGLIQTLLSMLNRSEVTHVAVAFDTEIKSFRNELYPQYKDGSDTPDELKEQFPVAEQAVEALGIVKWSAINFEADDILASAAVSFLADEEVEQIIICSPDKDLSQVVKGNEIVCFDSRKGMYLDASGVVDKFGVPPKSIPDYLGLAGDSADGIPGVPRWGIKASSTLLYRYKHIENIPTRHELWDIKVRGAAGLSKSLENHRKEAKLYKMLASLRLDVLIAENASDLQWRGAIKSTFPRLCENLGIDRLATQPYMWR